MSAGQRRRTGRIGPMTRQSFERIVCTYVRDCAEKKNRCAWVGTGAMARDAPQLPEPGRVGGAGAASAGGDAGGAVGNCARLPPNDGPAGRGNRRALRILHSEYVLPG